MPRTNREDEPGAIQHVFAHAVAGQLLFIEVEDAELYLRLLAQAVVDFEWICLSYCLMTNHVHLLLETPRGNLSAGMQWLHWRYALEFNRQHGRCGHCFDRPFGNKRIRTQEQFVAVARYIPLNPVEAKLCTRPEEWAWSSYGPLMSGSEPTWMGGHRLLWFLGSTERYRRLVLTPLR
jgi:REP element-mobilizing transposase RayT